MGRRGSNLVNMQITYHFALGARGNEIVSSFKAYEKAAVSGVLINQENNNLYTAGGDGVVKTWQ